jgi:hypothetical protein
MSLLQRVAMAKDDRARAMDLTQKLAAELRATAERAREAEQTQPTCGIAQSRPKRSSFAFLTPNLKRASLRLAAAVIPQQ